MKLKPELLSDIFAVLGALIIVLALAWIWKPLGLLALGASLLLLGWACAVKAAKEAAKAASPKS
jgi:hypothetical protein